MLLGNEDRKGGDKNETFPVFPQMSLNKCTYAELKSLHLSNLTGLFFSFPLFIQNILFVLFNFLFLKSPLDSDQSLYIPRSWSPQYPDSGALSASVHPYLERAEAEG